MRHELGRKNVFFVHVSLVPFMGASGEQKTKPTQHSVAALRSIGIQPDALVLRSDRPVTESNKRKIALMCDVDEQAVVNAVDVPSIYDIPTMLNDQGLDSYIIDTARPHGPRRRLERLAAAPRRRARAQARGQHRPGRQVHRPARRLPVGHRGAARRRVRAPDQGEDPLDPVRRVPDRGGRRAPAVAPRRHLRARRLRRARHRGQARGAEVRAREWPACPRPVPRTAVHGHRVRPRCGGSQRRLVERVRPRDGLPRHRDDGGAGRDHRRRRHGRNDAPRSLPRRARRGLPRRRAVRRARDRPSATATATR